jgi:hypothetical protein
LESIPNVSQPDVLMYNPLTKAVSYGNVPPAPLPDLSPITLDKQSSRVGINNTTPQHALDVVGGVNIPNTNMYKIGGKNAISFQSSDYTAVVVGSEDAIPSTSVKGICIGREASVGSYGVSIGTASARTNQGPAAVSIGNYAGHESQGQKAIAIGSEAGTRSQGEYAIAIGTAAGTGAQLPGFSQGSDAIAIGRDAGRESQGISAIAIGLSAGKVNQHANSIILNATGSPVNSAAPSTFHVKPIRAVADPTMPRLSYNATTGEIMYDTTTPTRITGSISADVPVPSQTRQTVVDVPFAAGLYMVTFNVVFSINSTYTVFAGMYNSAYTAGYQTATQHYFDSGEHMISLSCPILFGTGETLKIDVGNESGSTKVLAVSANAKHTTGWIALKLA